MPQPQPTGQRHGSLDGVASAVDGRVVHFKGFGFIGVFQTIVPVGDAHHWATDELTVMPQQRHALEQQAFAKLPAWLQVVLWC